MTGVITKKGVNAQRKMFSNQVNYDNEMIDAVTSAFPRLLYRAVVVDVVFDPVAMSSELLEKYSDISNFDLLQTAPRNSVIAKIVSDSADKRNSRASLFYPFFSHMHAPIKPGEKIWVIFEKPEGSHILGYWLSRVVERRDIDDPNYTHGDRAFVDELVPSTIDRAESSSSERIPGFPNGSDTEEGLTLNERDGYELIQRESIANRISTREPVPRYNKRPNDNVLEGSHNSILVLGDDRTGSTAKVVSGKVQAKPDQDKQRTSGMFGLIAGRGLDENGRYLNPGVKPTKAEPAVVKNARDQLETDKTIENENPLEGDIDFENDAAIIYGAMDSDVDRNFGKLLPKLNAGADPQHVESGPVVAIKSEHIRIIAKDNGTLRIIKEGVLDDESGSGHACLVIEKDGTIILDGPRIVIGSGIEKNNGEGTQVFLGRDATEPSVLGTTNRTVVTDYSTSVNNSINEFTLALQQLASALITPPNSLGNFGIPLPGLLLIANALTESTTKLKASMTEATQKLHADLEKTLSRNSKLR